MLLAFFKRSYKILQVSTKPCIIKHVHEGTHILEISWKYTTIAFMKALQYMHPIFVTDKCIKNCSSNMKWKNKKLFRKYRLLSSSIMVFLEIRSPWGKKKSWRSCSSFWATTSHSKANYARFCWTRRWNSWSKTSHVEFQLPICSRKYGRSLQGN